MTSNLHAFGADNRMVSSILSFTIQYLLNGEIGNDLYLKEHCIKGSHIFMRLPPMPRVECKTVI